MSLSLVILAYIRNPDAAVLRNFFDDLQHGVSGGVSGQDVGNGSASSGVVGHDVGVGSSSNGLSGQDFGFVSPTGGVAGHDVGVGSSGGELDLGASGLSASSSGGAMQLSTGLVAPFGPQPGCPPIASKREVGCNPYPHPCIREAIRYGCDPSPCFGKRCTPIDWMQMQSAAAASQSFVNQPSSVMSAFG